ncbi:PINIT domain-containing protein [Dichotomocladium elegans]|nr:PINIT domain-containing protein [Dichotomocladium elegans]
MANRKGEPHWIAHNGVVYNRPLLMAEPRGRLLTHGSHSDTATSSSSPSSSVPPRLADITRSCPTVTYKSGPFYTVIHILCAPKVCEVAPFSRNSETFKFTFDEEQRRLLRLTDPEFQIRFCCAVLPVPSTNNPLLLEFPPICEIKVNSHTIQAQVNRIAEGK